jgi:hypothetical protein
MYGIAKFTKRLAIPADLFLRIPQLLDDIICYYDGRVEVSKPNFQKSIFRKCIF